MYFLSLETKEIHVLWISVSCCHPLAPLPSRSTVLDVSTLSPHLFQVGVWRNGGVTRAGARHKEAHLAFTVIQNVKWFCTMLNLPIKCSPLAVSEDLTPVCAH